MELIYCPINDEVIDGIICKDAGSCWECKIKKRNPRPEEE